MKKWPPHLPYKSCSVLIRKTFLKLRFLLLYTFLGLLAGITGALVVFAWILPSIQFGDSSFFVNRNNFSLFNEFQYPDSQLIRNFGYTSVDIFDASRVVSDSFYSEDSLVAKAVVLSSNGWVVLHKPDFNFNMTNNWTVVDSRGVEQTIEKTLFDAHFGFVYLKLGGNEFRVVSFPEWKNLILGTELWTVGNSWAKTTLGEYEMVEDSVYKAIDDYSRITLNIPADEGDILINEQGQFVGFVDSDGKVRSARFVEYALPSILENEKISHMGVDWKGYFVRQVTVLQDGESLLGFYVMNGGNGVRAEDIVLSINGERVFVNTLQQQILFSPDEFTAQVWRNGEKIDILVKKKMLD